MRISIGGKNEVVLIAGYGKQVFHYLRGTVICYPMLYQTVQELLTVFLVRVGIKTSFNDTAYAVFLLDVAELAAEHLVIGENVITLGDGQSVACADEQGIGILDGLGGSLYLCHINILLTG